MENSGFENLFIFEVANNHQGDLAHGLNIVRAMADIARGENINGAVKFQFRALDTFIHPEHRDNQEHKHIQRFFKARLEKDEFAVLLAETKKLGLKSVCTAFDEESVDDIVNMGFDIFKIASCSANDWPLLKKIASAGRPTILSTAGMTMDDVDRAANTLLPNVPELALLHCVALYPTPDNALNLARIAQLKQRFPKLTVGFSTHEAPQNRSNIQLAYAAGARIFEKHVGMPHPLVPVNSYSALPEQVAEWVRSWKIAVSKLQSPEEPNISLERKSLRELKRGVFARRPIKAGSPITTDDVYFAMPYSGDSFASCTEWNGSGIARRTYESHEPIEAADAAVPDAMDIYRGRVLALLREARIDVDPSAPAWFSHHYGMETFDRFGAVLITLHNTGFCKKLIAMLPGQYHPEHSHLVRDEVIEVLHGSVEMVVDGKRIHLEKGSRVTILQGSTHDFYTADGAVIEEITSVHTGSDSVYGDARIKEQTLQNRRTPFFPAVASHAENTKAGWVPAFDNTL